MKKKVPTIPTFPVIADIYIKTNTDMRRIYRDLGDDTKMRISQSLKGRTFSDSHRQAISDAMKEYWATIPYYRDTEENNEANDGGREDEKSL